jgi:spermidine/putrescine-binding protein
MKTTRSLLLAAGLLAGLASAPAAELNLFGWSEYIPQNVIDAFTKETGVKVNFETYASNEELIAKLVAGGGKYDLVQPSDYAAEVMIRQKLLAPLDAAKLGNRGNLLPDFRRRAHDPEDRYTVPYMSGSVGIVINTDKVKTPVKTYRDVFDAKFANRIVVLNDNREIVTWALYSLGLPINRIDAAALAKARPIIGEWVKRVKVFDSDSPKTRLERRGRAALEAGPEVPVRHPRGGRAPVPRRASDPRQRAEQGCRPRLHELHPAPGDLEAHLRRLPLHQSERRRPQTAHPRRARQPGQLPEDRQARDVP